MKVKIKINKTQKIVWTIYILLFVILYTNQTILSLIKPKIISPEEIKLGLKPNPTWYQYLWYKFLYLGWIPTIILHLIWRGDKTKNEKI